MTERAPQLWIDADACPVAIREVLFRAAQRTGLTLTLVANQYLRTPPSKHITAVQVASGFDKADDYIEEHAIKGDLVITQDIPLAAKLVELGAIALSPRGVLYDAESVKSHLARRDLREELRGAGMVSGGPPPLSAPDIRQFSNKLDQTLARMRPHPGSSS